MHIELNTEEMKGLVSEIVLTKLNNIRPDMDGLFGRNGVSTIVVVTKWSDQPEGREYWSAVDTVYRHNYMELLRAKKKQEKYFLGIV